MFAELFQKLLHLSLIESQYRTRYIYVKMEMDGPSGNDYSLISANSPGVDFSYQSDSMLPALQNSVTGSL